MRARVRFVIVLRSVSWVMAFLFVLRIDADDDCAFLRKQFLKMISPTTIGCDILTPPSGFEALSSHIGVFF